MLTAAPVILKPREEIGAPGLTDFVKIYIAVELNKSEYRTVLRHEQAHVWAGHNRRRPKNAQNKFWQLACEIEIARTIYDERDLEIIKNPRSRLVGGILPESVAELPADIILAEDIYAWLLLQPEITMPENCGCGCDCNAASGDAASGDAVDHPADAVAAAREKLDAEDIAAQSQAAAIATYKIIRNRPPTLVAEIDAALRVRVERERSYRRPSRRSVDNVIMVGAISRPRPPLVEIFVDRSGSFSPAKTASAEAVLMRLLARYGASIRADVWYFGNQKLTASDPGGGGDTPYNLVAAQILVSMPKLAIIITDGDPVSPSVHPIHGPKILCIPIGCARTQIATALGGIDILN